jgi:hypothetical protein
VGLLIHVACYTFEKFLERIEILLTKMTKIKKIIEKNDKYWRDYDFEVDVGTGRTDSQYRQGQETHSEIILILFYSRSSLVSCSDEVQKQNGTFRFFSFVMSQYDYKMLQIRNNARG